jgi:hypothetical protein
MTVTIILNVVEMLEKVARYNSREFVRCRISIIHKKYDSLAPTSRRLKLSLSTVLVKRRLTVMGKENTRNLLSWEGFGKSELQHCGYIFPISICTAAMIGVLTGVTSPHGVYIGHLAILVIYSFAVPVPVIATPANKGDP